jgi:hypothetical protein
VSTRGFDPVYCRSCAKPREQVQYQPRTWTVLPCDCGGAR